MLVLYQINSSLSMNPGIGVTRSAVSACQPARMSLHAVHVSRDALQSTYTQVLQRFANEKA